MSTRFFQSVRRNQKQWMVVVTVLSMVSFLFLDDFGRGKGPMSALGGALMIGSLCAAGMCIVGYPRQKTAEYGIGGFLVGFAAGFVGFGAVSANKPVVRTATGSLTRADLDSLKKNRQRFNAFLAAVANKTKQGMGIPYVGLDDPQVVNHQLRAAEAKKMGIEVSDARVNEYLAQLTHNKLTNQEFKECLRDARLGENELFEILKSEIAAGLVANLTEPPGYIPPLPPELGMNLAGIKQNIWYMQETPEQLWSTYEKLHVKESLLAAPIPVKDFVSKVADPSDAELTAFFDKYKFNTWIDESRPGFVQLPRVQLAYLTGDFQQFEKGTEPTDAEVQEYYDRNKEQFPVLRGKESTAPNLPQEPADALKPESIEADAVKSIDEKKEVNPESKVDPASDGEAKKPAVDHPKSDSPEKLKESDKQKERKPADEPKSNCGEQEAEEKTAPNDAGTSKPEAAKEKEKVETDGAPAADSANKEAESHKDKSELTIPPSPSDQPKPNYRELNDDLKLEIRETIVAERAYARLTADLDKAREYMVDLSLEYDTLTDAGKKREMAKTIADSLRAYAVEHKFEYEETPELTQQELNSLTIGRATDTKGRASVVDQVFTFGSRSPLPLYSPRRADLKAIKAAFAYWKIGELPSRVADLKDEKIHAQAVAAWKFDKARQLAEERAKELVKKVKADHNDMAAALSGESVTGDKSEEPIRIIPTIDFSWLSTNRSFPSAGDGPKISTIPLINNIDESFMKTVFDDLANGETGLAVDEPRAVYYVVKVVNRDTPTEEDGGIAQRETHERFMKEDFASQFFPYVRSVYQWRAHIPQRQIEMAAERRAAQQDQLEWEETAPLRPRR